MKPTLVPSAETWLSLSDLDGDVVSRVKELANRLAVANSAPDYLSDDDKKAFRAAREALTPKRQADAMEYLQIGMGCATAFLFVIFLLPILRGFIRDQLFGVVVLFLTILGLLVFAQAALALWRNRIKRKKASQPCTVSLALRFLKRQNASEKAYCEAAAALLQEPPPAAPKLGRR